MRRWSLRHATALSRIYLAFEAALRRAGPLLAKFRSRGVESVFGATEKAVKGVLFDCRMCGQCVLSSTGMSCPMNCPKTLRNGPCGGVRPDGTCEVVPAMHCVWVGAYESAKAMAEEGRLVEVLSPLDHRLWGRSSWLAVARGELVGAKRP
jgi:hypothetical protein